MVKKFFSDLENSKQAEQVARECLSALTSDYTFSDVSNIRDYFYKGDIMAVGADGSRTFIEVKQDSRIHETGNVLCEEKVLFFDTGMKNGNMQSNYDVYCVVSIAARKMWLFDFNIMKANYKKGRYIKIPHEEQITFAYLVPIATFEKMGALIAEISY